MNKRGKTALKILFVLAIVGVIIYTFHQSANDMIKEMMNTSVQVLLVIFGLSIIYHLFEAWTIYLMAIRYQKEFTYKEAVECAFYCSFYRLSTLGSGAGAAAVMFLGQRGIDYSLSLGLYTIRYMIHKVSIALFCVLFFVGNWSLMVTEFSQYRQYLLTACGITLLISTGLVLFAVSKHFHDLIIHLVEIFNRTGRLEGVVEKLRHDAKLMERSTKELIRDWKMMVGMILIDLCKIAFWFVIPYVIIGPKGGLSLGQTMAITALSVMTAAVLPAPAGIGAAEFVMINLFGVIVGVGKAGAVAILYRVATFVFPFVIGGIMIVLMKARKK